MPWHWQCATVLHLPRRRHVTSRPAPLVPPITIQVTMAAGRFIVIGVLVGTTLSSFDCDGTAFAGYTNQISTPTFAAVAGLKIVIPVAVYAQVRRHRACCHAALPLSMPCSPAGVGGGQPALLMLAVLTLCL